MIAGTVSQLYIHPIKSCRGSAVSQIELDRRGVVGDRRFLIVDANGRFLTQRTEPRLAGIVPSLTPGGLTLATKGVTPLRVPLAENGTEVSRPVVIWRDTVPALDLGDEAASWLSHVLDQPVRLVGTGRDFARPMNGPAAHPGDEIAFNDAHPLLLLSEASLADLNARLDVPLPMNRFRPNLVVRDTAAFAEDSWKRIRIGPVILRASGPCERCVITTTDQETLERGKEPLRTLATYRKNDDGGVCFGQNFIHETKSGTIRVGDPVEILA